MLDSLYELNTETPKLKISRESPPKPSLIFGLLSESGSESKVFDMLEEENQDRKRLGFVGAEAKGVGHADADNGEVQTVNIWRGGKKPGHEHEHEHGHEHSHQHTEASTSTSQTPLTDSQVQSLTKERLDEYLSKVPSEEVWRVKGFLKLSDSEGDINATSSYHILNWAFGRHELHPASERMSEQLRQQGVEVRLTVMGARGDAKRRSKILAKSLGADVSQSARSIF